MHELSLAYSLVEAAEAAARRANAAEVIAVYMRIGELAGVVEDALRFGYDIATKGTLLEGSRLEIETLPVVVFCPTCKAEVTLDSIQSFRCPICGTLTGDLRQGKELEIVSMEINEHETTSS